ncbi:MAG: hypothetical protein LBJ32_03650 [Oscillospiraceae bacterium]|jgi:hypothetical protein|nr:hypothetical protein [Oscillospiraceae bacterium]
MDSPDESKFILDPFGVLSESWRIDYLIEEEQIKLKFLKLIFMDYSEKDVWEYKLKVLKLLASRIASRSENFLIIHSELKLILNKAGMSLRRHL